MVKIFHEVKRVLKNDGTLWLNLGDSYNAGRDGGHAGGIKQNHSKYQQKSGANVKYLKPKDLVGIPWMVAFALRTDGWYLRQDIIWSKPNPMPESVKDRCTKSHEYIFLLSKSKKYYYDSDAIKEPSTYPDDNRKSRTKEHQKYAGVGKHNRVAYGSAIYPTKNKRSVWVVNTKPYKEAHFAVFPEELITPCILAGCPEGGVIIDPFFGSGTSGCLSEKLNRKWIGIDLNKEYCKIAKERITIISKPKDSIKYFF